jgi:hypothetical protein
MLKDGSLLKLELIVAVTNFGKLLSIDPLDMRLQYSNNKVIPSTPRKT